MLVCSQMSIFYLKTISLPQIYSMKRLLFSIICLAFIMFSQAQIENVVLTLHLKNGDIITGTTEITQILFKTSYGNLNIPVGDVNSIKVGLQNSNFDKGRLLDLLDKLDNGNSKERDNAFDEIIKMNEGAIPFIKSYLQSSNKQNNNELSVQVLYEVMLAKYNVSKNYNLYDELLYNSKNTVEGTYDFEHIVLETSYGRIKIARTNIEQIDIKIKPKEGFSKDNTFKVFANRYISGNKEEGWLNTGILVKKGEEISINADGQVSLASLSGNKYTPDGGLNGAPGPTDKKITYGNLVFKISQNGTIKKAGDKIIYTADRTGIIFLSIHESVFNSANAGYYNANVRVKP